MPFKWGCGGQDFPDEISESPIVSNWSCLTTFMKGSPPRNGSNYVKTVGVLIPSNGVVGVRRFLMMVLSPSTGPEDDFRLFNCLKSPLLG